MQFETINQAVSELKKHQETIHAYQHAMGVLSLDATTAAPAGSWEGRGKTLEILNKIIFEMETQDEIGVLLAFLESNAANLDAVTYRQVEVMRKNYNRMKQIPADEYVEYSVLLNDADYVWHKAKAENDFASYAPYLEKIISFNRKFAGYYNPQMDPFDALLNEYEEGMCAKTLDPFFADLRETIVPLIAKIKQRPQLNNDFLKKNYPVEKQREFSNYLMEVMGLDRNYCGIAETEHPFTTNFNNRDVRITTNYHENDIASSLYSVVHEGGHALYELGAEDQYNYTVLSGGVSMGIHESQSRFYENIIGRSEAFVNAIFPKMKELFPEQLAEVTANDFYKAVNRAEPGLIRIEADELTYCLHIMVRYEIEKKMISGELAVADIPAQWNRLYKEYLGVDVLSDREGCLQDSHWSGGGIGYFPSYALGSAYGAQMLAKMEEDLGNVFDKVARGDLSDVTAWLKEKIHRHASMYKPGDLFNSVCGEFDPQYYITYLKNKFTTIYEL